MTRLHVRVIPRANRDAVEGFDMDGVLQVRVAAAPVDGEANEAVRRLLAKALGIPPRDVVLASGAASRRKIFDIPLDADVMRERLAP